MAFDLPPGLEKRLNRLSMKNRFLNRVLCFIFMPLVYRSGLRVNYDPDNYYALLPKKRFNLNWYGTMAGGAILGNSELAAGSYLFMLTKGEYRMVCKHLDYRFLLPSTCDVIYKASLDEEELAEKVKAGGKFNITMDIKLYRAASKTKTGKRMGSGVITFHVWPVGS